jgi:hypothetical protein
MIISADLLKSLATRLSTVKVLTTKSGLLPVNDQRGGTCAIYSLAAALQLKNHKLAPPRSKIPDKHTDVLVQHWKSDDPKAPKSLRWKAKQLTVQGGSPMSRIGEIAGPSDLKQLATSLSIPANVETFDSETSLWNVMVRCVENNQCVVFPYASDEDGTPIWNSKAFAHWCLLFGYGTTTKHVVYMTTYNRYHAVTPFQLYMSNKAVKDFPDQTWIKVALFTQGHGKDIWQYWRGEWMSKSGASVTLKQMTEDAKKADNAFGIGPSKNGQVVYTLYDPRTKTITAPAEMTTTHIIDSVNFDAITYTQTFPGRCVSV